MAATMRLSLRRHFERYVAHWASVLAVACVAKRRVMIMPRRRMMPNRAMIFSRPNIAKRKPDQDDGLRWEE